MNTEKFNPVFYLWAGSVKTGHMVAELLNKHGLCVEETEFPLVKCSDGEKRDLFQVPEKIFAELETAEADYDFLRWKAFKKSSAGARPSFMKHRSSVQYNKKRRKGIQELRRTGELTSARHLHSPTD